MPSDVVAELGDEDEVESEDEEEVVGLLANDQIDSLAERLREIVTERPSELKDTLEDQQVQAAIDGLLTACNGDAEIAFAVMAIRLANGL
jgi:hypothetical protein